jgi:deazaflavin-dependent oxidoreductase (nitroreductase family)
MLHQTNLNSSVADYASNNNKGDSINMTTMNDWNRQTIEKFRANGGKVGGYWEGKPLLLLTSTGAKSGQRRTTPITYLADGNRLLVFASNRGEPTNPDWYHNLVAHPQVTVEVGDETYEATATILTGEERDRFYARQVEISPQFGEYQAKTTRKIPVIALERLKG